MKIVAIANPKACNGKVGKKWDAYSQQMLATFGHMEFMLTRAPGEMTALVKQAIHEGAQRIVVVGGDGSANEAINGFLENDKPINAEASLSFWPAGTGSDFARSIGFTGNHISDGYNNAFERIIDIGKASFSNAAGQSVSRYFLNIASLGSSALIASKVNSTSKFLGGRLSFYIGSLRGLMAYRNQRVQITVDNHTEELMVNTVAVANARYFGGGMMIAPHALLDDGMLDIVVVGDVGILTFLKDSPQVYKGKHLEKDYVRCFRGKTVEIMPMGNTPLPMEFDGEPDGVLPARYEILPQAVKLFTPFSN